MVPFQLWLLLQGNLTTSHVQRPSCFPKSQKWIQIVIQFGLMDRSGFWFSILVELVLEKSIYKIHWFEVYNLTIMTWIANITTKKMKFLLCPSSRCTFEIHINTCLLLKSNFTLWIDLFTGSHVHLLVHYSLQYIYKIVTTCS